MHSNTNQPGLVPPKSASFPEQAFHKVLSGSFGFGVYK